VASHFIDTVSPVADDQTLACKEVHPLDWALFTMRGVGYQRVHLYAGEEKRYGEHFEDGRGVPTMSVRTGSELFGQKGTTTNQTSRSAYQ